MKNIYRLARGLGWFSIGLGVAELVFPESLEKFLGTPNRDGLLRFFGARELAAGVGILSSSKPAAGWLWARVGGDAIDLAALGAAFEDKHSDKANVAIATVAVVGVTVLDILCAHQLGKDK